MTCLAANPQLVRRDHMVGRDLERTSGVTTETAQDSRFGIKDAVPYAACGCVARRASNRVQFSVPGLVLLDIGFLVQPIDERDGLHAGAERPESRLRRLGRSQRACVGAGRLRGELCWMAFSASRRPGVIGGRHAEQRTGKQQGQETGASQELTQARILANRHA
jgi:hypothetical protein